ncbi:MAG: sigma-70 family RNA polymerase sigma factor [Planctomycetales bacterium]|nr:sigma-70 family RNA polymerase sigma factor [Planctomycetales bacterium]
MGDTSVTIFTGPSPESKALSAKANQTQLNPSTWVDDYLDYLYRYAFTRLRERNAAEEVVQETFLAGVRYADQFSGRGTERAWLLGILKRKIIDFLRQRAKHGGTSYEDGADLTAQLFDANGNWKANALRWTNSPGKDVELAELWDVVKGCLQGLPQGQADVFVLSVMALRMFGPVRSERCQKYFTKSPKARHLEHANSTTSCRAT